MNEITCVKYSGQITALGALYVSPYMTEPCHPGSEGVLFAKEVSTYQVLPSVFFFVNILSVSRNEQTPSN